MQIVPIRVGWLRTNCYLVFDETTKEGFLIDPGDHAPRILEEIRSRDIELRYIILTHSHFDHILALREVKDATGTQVAVHESDSEGIIHPGNEVIKAIGLPDISRLQTVTPNLILQDGDRIDCAGETLTVLHTPGHTAGSICLDTGKILFSGDTLFEDSCGRCDLPGGDVRAMMSSMHRLANLEGDRVVYPGHGPSTTLSRERTVNPEMRRALRDAYED